MPESSSSDMPESEHPANPVSVTDILLTTLHILHEKAFAYLGLLMHGETGEIREDFQQAKIAIDAMNALLPLIQPHLSDRQKMEITLSVTNAQLNYARKVGQLTREPSSSSSPSSESDSS